MAQSSGFNTRIYLEQRSTILRNIMAYGDSLLITGEIGRDSLGLSGYFVLRTDTLGKIGNIRFFRDPALEDHQLHDGREPVIINQTGNILLAGVFLARDDLFIMELTPSLDPLWYREYISDYLTMYVQNVTEYDGMYYITGVVQTQNYDLDVFIQKVDHEGNKIWEKTYGVPSRHETGRAAIIEDAGLTVMISESYDPTPTIKNDTRYWIRFMHIDTSGAIVRDWREEVTGYEGWSGTLLKYENDYIYTTNTIGEETNFGPLVGGQIVRRDSNFNVIWRKPFGQPDNHHNQLGDMTLSADSSCLLVAGNIFDTDLGFSWARVMRVGLDGKLLCEVRDTGIWHPALGSSNRLEGIAESESGSIYAVGYTYRRANVYEGLLLKVTPDGCIDTLFTTTAIEDYIRLQEEKMVLYPNPARDEITIEVSRDIPPDAMLMVYNLKGVEMYRGRLTDTKHRLDVSVWPAGSYIVWLMVPGSNTSLVKKMIKLE